MTVLSSRHRWFAWGVFGAVLLGCAAAVAVSAGHQPPSPPTPLPAGERGERCSPLPSGERGERCSPLPSGERGERRSPLSAGEKGRGEGTDAPRSAADLTPEKQAALEEGKALFRGLCSGCHGGNGRGGKGPDLTDDRWIHGDSDDDIARVIRNGVPKTTMKKLGDSLKEEQIHKLILYIRSLARAPGETTWKPYLPGDAKAGHQLFFDPKSKTQCAKCHAIGGEGGRIGPSLDRIANRRSAEYIMQSILEPSKDIDPQYEAVQVVTKKGHTLVGLRVNESNFSIQLREENGQFHSLLKRDLDEVVVLKKSLMPENFAEQLTVKELHDLFAYLMTLQ